MDLRLLLYEDVDVTTDSDAVFALSTKQWWPSAQQHPEKQN